FFILLSVCYLQTVRQPDRANRVGLYFLLMYLDSDSHRFFIAPNLIAGLHVSFDWRRAPYL
ncbi:MAG TPA: hypothetical protein VMT72_22405, partial [Pseudolabrys sp.]|nr:hypothetical protein [Pseudolabrys sp.]